MTLDLFHQFSTPYLLGIPLLLLALLAPTLLLHTPPHVTLNRVTALKTQLTFSITKHLSTPLSPMGHTWSLPLTAVFLYLLYMNLLGLLPYTFTPTAQLALSMAISLPLWLSTVLMGLRHQPTLALAHLLPVGTPNLLIPILILIETISLFIRPVALGVRLTANLTAGHLLIALTSTALTALTHTFPPLLLPPLILFALLFILEIAVAMIQAYVFVLLLSLYLQENT